MPGREEKNSSGQNLGAGDPKNPPLIFSIDVPGLLERANKIPLLENSKLSKDLQLMSQAGSYSNEKIKASIIQILFIKKVLASFEGENDAVSQLGDIVSRVLDEEDQPDSQNSDDVKKLISELRANKQQEWVRLMMADMQWPGLALQPEDAPLFYCLEKIFEEKAQVKERIREYQCGAIKLHYPGFQGHGGEDKPGGKDDYQAKVKAFIDALPEDYKKKVGKEKLHDWIIRYVGTGDVKWSMAVGVHARNNGEYEDDEIIYYFSANVELDRPLLTTTHLYFNPVTERIYTRTTQPMFIKCAVQLTEGFVTTPNLTVDVIKYADFESNQLGAERTTVIRVAQGQVLAENEILLLDQALENLKPENEQKYCAPMNWVDARKSDSKESPSWMRRDYWKKGLSNQEVHEKILKTVADDQGSRHFTRGGQSSLEQYRAAAEYISHRCSVDKALEARFCQGASLACIDEEKRNYFFKKLEDFGGDYAKLPCKYVLEGFMAENMDAWFEELKFKELKFKANTRDGETEPTDDEQQKVEESLKKVTEFKKQKKLLLNKLDEIFIFKDKRLPSTDWKFLADRQKTLTALEKIKSEIVGVAGTDKKPRALSIIKFINAFIELDQANELSVYDYYGIIEVMKKIEKREGRWYEFSKNSLQKAIKSGLASICEVLAPPSWTNKALSETLRLKLVTGLDDKAAMALQLDKPDIASLAEDCIRFYRKPKQPNNLLSLEAYCNRELVNEKLGKISANPISLPAEYLLQLYPSLNTGQKKEIINQLLKDRDKASEYFVGPENNNKGLSDGLKLWLLLLEDNDHEIHISLASVFIFKKGQAILEANPVLMEKSFFVLLNKLNKLEEQEQEQKQEQKKNSPSSDFNALLIRILESKKNQAILKQAVLSTSPDSVLTKKLLENNKDLIIKLGGRDLLMSLGIANSLEKDSVQFKQGVDKFKAVCALIKKELLVEHARLMDSRFFSKKERLLCLFCNDIDEKVIKIIGRHQITQDQLGDSSNSSEKFYTEMIKDFFESKIFDKEESYNLNDIMACKKVSFGRGMFGFSSIAKSKEECNMIQARAEMRAEEEAQERKECAESYDTFENTISPYYVLDLAGLKNSMYFLINTFLPGIVDDDERGFLEHFRLKIKNIGFKESLGFVDECSTKSRKLVVLGQKICEAVKNEIDTQKEKKLLKNKFELNFKKLTASLPKFENECFESLKAGLNIKLDSYVKGANDRLGVPEQKDSNRENDFKAVSNAVALFKDKIENVTCYAGLSEEISNFVVKGTDEIGIIHQQLFQYLTLLKLNIEFKEKLIGLLNEKDLSYLSNHATLLNVFFLGMGDEGLLKCLVEFNEDSEDATRIFFYAVSQYMESSKKALAGIETEVSVVVEYHAKKLAELGDIVKNNFSSLRLKLDQSLSMIDNEPLLRGTSIENDIVLFLTALVDYMSPEPPADKQYKEAKDKIKFDADHPPLGLQTALDDTILATSLVRDAEFFAPDEPSVKTPATVDTVQGVLLREPMTPDTAEQTVMQAARTKFDAGHPPLGLQTTLDDTILATSLVRSKNKSGALRVAKKGAAVAGITAVSAAIAPHLLSHLGHMAATGSAVGTAGLLGMSGLFVKRKTRGGKGSSESKAKPKPESESESTPSP